MEQRESAEIIHGLLFHESSLNFTSKVAIFPNVYHAMIYEVTLFITNDAFSLRRTMTKHTETQDSNQSSINFP